MKKKNIRNINILQILKYHLPITGIISIIHRISGILIIILIPIILKFFYFILISNENFLKFKLIIHNIYIKILFFFINQIFVYHIFSGFRYFIIDMNYQIKKKSYLFSYLIIFISFLFNLLFIINY